MLITTADQYEGSLPQLLHEYKYLPELTASLQQAGREPFSQEMINEIVLWKHNRYVRVPPELNRRIDELARLAPGNHRQAEGVLKDLLQVNGVRLAVASTILRFKNPSVFQILDRHAYRAVYGKLFRDTTTNLSRRVNIYFEYLDRLIDLCQSRDLEFESIDRILYVFDKAVNPPLTQRASNSNSRG